MFTYLTGMLSKVKSMGFSAMMHGYLAFDKEDRLSEFIKKNYFISIGNLIMDIQISGSEC